MSTLNQNRWFRAGYPCCIRCGTTKKPHEAKGLCAACYGAKRYHTTKGKEAHRRYQQSSKGKETAQSYYQSPRGKEVRRRFAQSPKGREYDHNYKQSLKGKASEQRRRRSPKTQAYYQAYRQYYNHSPEGKIAQRGASRRYYQTSRGKEVRRASRPTYRARKIDVDFWTEGMSLEWQSMVEVTEGYCLKCGVYVSVERMTMDHIVPLSLVGKVGVEKAIALGAIHHINNVQPMCISCNRSKSDKIIKEVK